VLGGPSFLPAGLFYAFSIAALVLAKLSHGGPWTWIGVVFVVTFLHVVAAITLPRILAQNGQHQRAIGLCAYNLSAPFMIRRARRAMRLLQVQSLLALGRGETARKILPEAVATAPPSSQRPLGDQIQRLTLAAGFTAAGLDGVAEELLDVGGWTRFRPHRDVQLSAVLWSQGRAAEARELIAPMDAPEVPPERRAVIHNNLAVYGIDLGEDSEDVLEHARQAVALDPRQVPFRHTLGAAMLNAGGDPEEALELMEREAPNAPGPQGRAWLDLHRGRACEHLDRLDDARRYYRQAAAVEGPAGSSAAERLQALDSDRSRS
jgi:tetratricopeptide (TPR) repeat protein